MNRLEFKEILADVMREIEMPGGHFNALYELSAQTKKDAEFIAAVSLMAVDRYYSYVTRMNFKLREADEHR